MKKRACGLLFCMILTAVLLFGCGQSASSGSGASGKDAEAPVSEEAETIRVYSMNMGSAEEYRNVQDAINAVTVPGIGVEVELTFLDMGQWLEKINMILSGGEEVDLLPLFYANYLPTGVSQGAFAPLDDLLDAYGEDIRACVGEDYLSCTTFDGSIYAVPAFYEYGFYLGFEYDAGIARDLGLEEEIAAVRTMDDWTGILEKVHEAYPEIRAFASNGGNTIGNFNYSAFDELGDYLGGLDLEADSTGIVNLFATEEYYDFCKVMESWYDAGYISADEITLTDTFNTVCSAGEAFSTLANYHMTSKAEFSATIGREVDFAPLYGGKEFTDTSTVTAVWCIPESSEHKEAAMKFLNLMFTDSELENLYLWGVEGENYRITEDGFADYADGENAETTVYRPNLSFVAPNHYIALSWEGGTYATEEEVRDFNDRADPSPAMGFTFDGTAVANEVSDCNAVLDRYRIALETGSVEVDEVLPEFLEALDEAGIDAVIAEKQKQLDRWLAE